MTTNLEYTENLINDYKETIAEQEKRIKELKNENSELKKDLRCRERVKLLHK
ncbi:MAG: hypothetical protein FWD60_13845 [Candidatus Azobacteroides sp.]|nr:hypothetical protein [Candidatus Azobacteroides sp.]